MKNQIKHILILGGSSDIGIEVSKNFLNLGWIVTAHFSKNQKKLKILKKYNTNLKTIKFDFNNYNNFNFEKLLSKKFNGTYDSVVNLIGYIDNKSFEKASLESILKSIAINAIIPFLIEKIVIKKMLKQKWGRILNCSSIGIKFGGGKNSYNYSLSKHCLEFIPNTYKNWAKKNVFINNLRIGMTDTKIHKRMKKNLRLKDRIKLIPINRMAKPQEISEHIINFVTDSNSYMTGQTITVSGGE